MLNGRFIPMNGIRTFINQFLNIHIVLIKLK